MYYRLYRLDAFGHVVRAHPVVAKDDAAAVARAHALGYRGVVEVWQRDRKIASVAPEPSEGAAG